MAARNRLVVNKAMSRHYHNSARAGLMASCAALQKPAICARLAN